MFVCFIIETIHTFKIWRLITFESLELNEKHIPHFKKLMCGIDASSPQLCGCLFILCYTHLNLILLLHKTVLITFPLASAIPSLLLDKGVEKIVQILEMYSSEGY